MDLIKGLIRTAGRLKSFDLTFSAFSLTYICLAWNNNWRKMSNYVQIDHTFSVLNSADINALFLTGLGYAQTFLCFIYRDIDTTRDL